MTYSLGNTTDVVRNKSSEYSRKRLTQPKGWRIFYNLKPQFVNTSIEPFDETDRHEGHLIRFRSKSIRHSQK